MHIFTFSLHYFIQIQVNVNFVSYIKNIHYNYFISMRQEHYRLQVQNFKLKYGDRQILKPDFLKIVTQLSQYEPLISYQTRTYQEIYDRLKQANKVTMQQVVNLLSYVKEKNSEDIREIDINFYENVIGNFTDENQQTVEKEKLLEIISAQKNLNKSLQELIMNRISHGKLISISKFRMLLNELDNSLSQWRMSFIENYNIQVQDTQKQLVSKFAESTQTKDEQLFNLLSKEIKNPNLIEKLENYKMSLLNMLEESRQQQKILQNKIQYLENDLSEKVYLANTYEEQIYTQKQQIQQLKQKLELCYHKQSQTTKQLKQVLIYANQSFNQFQLSTMQYKRQIKLLEQSIKQMNCKIQDSNQKYKLLSQQNIQLLNKLNKQENHQINQIKIKNDIENELELLQQKVNLLNVNLQKQKEKASRHQKYIEQLQFIKQKLQKELDQNNQHKFLFNQANNQYAYFSKISSKILQKRNSIITQHKSIFNLDALQIKNQISVIFQDKQSQSNITQHLNKQKQQQNTDQPSKNYRDNSTSNKSNSKIEENSKIKIPYSPITNFNQQFKKSIKPQKNYIHGESKLTERKLGESYKEVNRILQKTQPKINLLLQEFNNQTQIKSKVQKVGQSNNNQQIINYDDENLRNVSQIKILLAKKYKKFDKTDFFLSKQIKLIKSNGEYCELKMLMTKNNIWFVSRTQMQKKEEFAIEDIRKIILCDNSFLIIIQLQSHKGFVLFLRNRIELIDCILNNTEISKNMKIQRCIQSKIIVNAMPLTNYLHLLTPYIELYQYCNNCQKVEIQTKTLGGYWSIEWKYRFVIVVSIGFIFLEDDNTISKKQFRQKFLKLIPIVPEMKIKEKNEKELVIFFPHKQMKSFSMRFKARKQKQLMIKKINDVIKNLENVKKQYQIMEKQLLKY